jgi:hypothetical protein
MSRGAKIAVFVAIAVLGVPAYYVYCFLYTWHHIPEAYAAWDTGTLLVEYMKEHENQWPNGWDELLSVLSDEADNKIKLRGCGPDRLKWAQSLRDVVSIDWSFDTSHSGAISPITRPDGSPFPIVWEEPNEMIRAYLKDHADSSPAQVP